MKVIGKNYIGHELSNEFASQFKTYNPVKCQFNDFLIDEVLESDAETALFKAHKAFYDLVHVSLKSRSDF